MMDDTRYIDAIVLPISKNDDETITCIMCNCAHCDLAIEIWGHGKHVWAGIHTKCLGRWREVQPNNCGEKDNKP